MDELRLHIRYIGHMMRKKRRILLFGLPGEGKSTLMNALQKKYPDWNFYDFGENIDECKEPFIYSIIHPDQEVPDYDEIYCIQYSTAFKEKLTGIKFPPGEWRPIADYFQKAEYNQRAKININGRKAGSMTELRKILKGEI